MATRINDRTLTLMTWEREASSKSMSTVSPKSAARVTHGTHDAPRTRTAEERMRGWSLMKLRVIMILSLIHI